MAALLVSDELWSRIEPLLPAHHSPGPEGGRPPIDDRAALTGNPTFATIILTASHEPPYLGR